MNKNQKEFRSLIVGVYSWVTAVFFGGILLDIVYANLISGTLGAFGSTAVFSEVSDVLLRIGFVTILAAIGAIAFSWKTTVARNLFIASLFIISFEFLIPVFFSRFIQSVQELNIDPWLRIIPSGLASALAFVGLYNYYRQK